MELKTETPSGVDKRFLIITAVIGLAALGANCYWLAKGEMELNYNSRKSLASDERAVAARLDTDDAAFYPLCITWVIASIALLGFTAAGVMSDEELFLKLSAWTLAGMVPLGVVSYLIARTGAG